jgi:hypothetical protein
MNKELQRGNFVMRGYGAGEVNVYDCADCKKEGISHEIRDVLFGYTDSSSCWGSGIPRTIRQCTGCGRADGPWVSSDIVGGGY